MKRGFVIALAVGSLMSYQASAQPRGPRRGDENASRLGWLFSLEAGRAEAKKSGKPLLVVVRCVP